MTAKRLGSVGTILTKKLWSILAIPSHTHRPQARSYRYTVHLVGEAPSIQARCFQSNTELCKRSLPLSETRTDPPPSSFNIDEARGRSLADAKKAKDSATTGMSS